MTGFLAAIKALVWKDLLLELRNKDVIVSVISFAILCMVIFNFAFGFSAKLSPMIAPGVLWVSITFAGVIGLNRIFLLETDEGNLIGLLTSPVSRESIYFAKMFSSLLFMVMAEAILLPIFAILFNVSLFQPYLILVVFLGTIGFAAIGTLFAAIAVNTRSRDIMLPMLFLPVVIPVIIGSVVASASILDGGSWTDFSKGIQLVVVFDVVALLISALTFGQVVQE